MGHGREKQMMLKAQQRYNPFGLFLVIFITYVLGMLLLSIFSEQIIELVGAVTQFSQEQTREDFGQFYHYISVAFLAAAGLVLAAMRLRRPGFAPPSGPVRRARDMALAATALLVPLIGIAYAGRPWLGLEGLFVEDGPSEWFTALVFLGAAVVFAARAWRARALRRLTAVACGTAAVIFAFIAFEEISYGQRLLGVATPGWLAEANDQGEISLHNLHNPLLLNAYPVAGLGLFAVMMAAAWWWQELRDASAAWGEIAGLLPDPALLPLGAVIAVVAQHPGFNELVEIFAALLLLFYLVWPREASAPLAERQRLRHGQDAARAT